MGRSGGDVTTGREETVGVAGAHCRGSGGGFTSGCLCQNKRVLLIVCQLYLTMKKKKRQATRHKRVKVLSGYFIKKDIMANKGIKGAQPLFIREIQHKTIKSHNFMSTRLAKTFLKSVVPARGRKQSMEPPKFMGLAL